MAGKLVHFELPASDTSRAKGFWSGVFGWEFGDSAMPDIEYSVVRTGDDQGGAVMLVFVFSWVTTSTVAGNSTLPLT